MNCKIETCDMETEYEYCNHHNVAYKQIEQQFENWKIAVGKAFSWNDYLINLISNDNVKSGILIKDVANYLINKDK